MKYDRALSSEFMAALGSPKMLQYLPKGFRQWTNGLSVGSGLPASYRLDLQLRKDDELMIYHGGTRILIIRYLTNKGTVEFDCGAYSHLKTAMALSKPGGFPHSPVLKGNITKYVCDAMLVILT